MTSQKAGERGLKASIAGSGIGAVLAIEGGVEVLNSSMDVDFRGPDSMIVEALGVDMVESDTTKRGRCLGPVFNRNSRGSADVDLIVKGIYSYIHMLLTVRSVPLVLISGPSGLSRFLAVEMPETH
jgi:hypothetical protein